MNKTTHRWSCIYVETEEGIKAYRLEKGKFVEPLQRPRQEERKCKMLITIIDSGSKINRAAIAHEHNKSALLSFIKNIPPIPDLRPQEKLPFDFDTFQDEPIF